MHVHSKHGLMGVLMRVLLGRKELSPENAKAFVKRNAKVSQHGLVTMNTSVKTPQRPSKLDTSPAQEVSSGPTKAVSHTGTAREEASQPFYRPLKASTCAPQHSQMVMKEDADRATRSNASYDMINRSFHRTFPVAAELEIDVEKFLIASSVSDRELEPNNSLSISQVEVLQESHWQAYHYLNEKKVRDDIIECAFTLYPHYVYSFSDLQIELTRILEAQRVQAQFDLQQELKQYK